MVNRFLLVVKNLAAPAAEVAWGATSRTFSKAELEAGVNLAEAFPDNPFSGPFAQLDRVVAGKQNRETQTIKGQITNFRALVADNPGDEEVTQAIALLRGKLLARNAQEAALARAAVKPVTHTLVVTPK